MQEDTHKSEWEENRGTMRGHFKPRKYCEDGG